MLATGLSGGLALAAGILIVYFLFALVFTPMELAPAEQGEMDAPIRENSGVTPAPSGGTPLFSEVLMKSFVFFFSGCFWSLTGALAAAVAMSRYMAYASPFVLYYTCIIINERYLKDIVVLNPKEWLNPQIPWPGEVLLTLLLLIELITVVSIAYTRCMRKWQRQPTAS